jgi:type VI secretion system secreted protein Hcp
MPMPFHMTLTGTSQGAIEGSCIMAGREGSILCEALEHEIYIPRDTQSGLATGKRVHKPLTITKVFDMSSPKLFQALVIGEHMTDVTFKYYRISAAGQEEHYFTVKLTEAIVVSIKAWIPNCLDPKTETLTHMEDVSFTYQKIGWTWVPDGIEAEDSWLVPK